MYLVQLFSEVLSSIEIIAIRKSRDMQSVKNTYAEKQLMVACVAFYLSFCYFGISFSFNSPVIICTSLRRKHRSVKRTAVCKNTPGST